MQGCKKRVLTQQIIDGSSIVCIARTKPVPMSVHNADYVPMAVVTHTQTMPKVAISIVTRFKYVASG